MVPGQESLSRKRVGSRWEVDISRDEEKASRIKEMRVKERLATRVKNKYACDRSI